MRSSATSYHCPSDSGGCTPASTAALAACLLTSDSVASHCTAVSDIVLSCTFCAGFLPASHVLKSTQSPLLAEAGLLSLLCKGELMLASLHQLVAEWLVVLRTLQCSLKVTFGKRLQRVYRSTCLPLPTRFNIQVCSWDNLLAPKSDSLQDSVNNRTLMQFRR